MRKLAIIVIISFFYITAISQNLVRNPSFEIRVKCPVILNNFNGYVKDWTHITNAEVSYFHSCANNNVAGVPYNWYGFQYARTGNAYASVYAKAWDWDPDKRGYITGVFSTVLERDSIYCVRYYTNLCDIANGAIKNMDAWLNGQN